MLTPRIMELHRYIDHDWQMTRKDFQVKGQDHSDIKRIYTMAATTTDSPYGEHACFTNTHNVEVDQLYITVFRVLFQFHCKTYVFLYKKCYLLSGPSHAYKLIASFIIYYAPGKRYFAHIFAHLSVFTYDAFTLVNVNNMRFQEQMRI